MERVHEWLRWLLAAQNNGSQDHDPNAYALVRPARVLASALRPRSGPRRPATPKQKGAFHGVLFFMFFNPGA